MNDMWERLGRPDVETILSEIATYDSEAAALARAVWVQIGAAEQEGWREQLAAAVLSYRGPHGKSRIIEIALSASRTSSNPDLLSNVLE